MTDESKAARDLEGSRRMQRDGRTCGSRMGASKL